MIPQPRSRSAWSRAWALLAFIALAAGCVSPRYVAPTAGPTAILSVGSPYKGVDMRVRTYETEDCADYPGQLIGLLNSKTLGIASENPIETRVAAGRDVTISVYAQTGIDVGGTTITTKACEPFTRFRPEVGARYLAEYQYAGGHCALPILRLVPDGATERRVPEPTAVANERCRPTTIKP
ncbi:MAG: hypothetical protein DMD78_14955 [Candidatus Rokuibacteriota bacterium]|nr:MAG: hypothetical protein DMD78_14955 [Candidatus Rokubacteria bacterium]